MNEQILNIISKKRNVFSNITVNLKVSLRRNFYIFLQKKISACKVEEIRFYFLVIFFEWDICKPSGRKEKKSDEEILKDLFDEAGDNNWKVINLSSNFDLVDLMAFTESDQTFDDREWNDIQLHLIFDAVTQLVLVWIVREEFRQLCGGHDNSFSF